MAGPEARRPDADEESGLHDASRSSRSRSASARTPRCSASPTDWSSVRCRCPAPGEVVTVIGQARDVGFGNRRLSYPDYVDLRDRIDTASDGLVAYTRSSSPVSRAAPTSRRSARSGSTVERQLLRRDGGSARRSAATLPRATKMRWLGAIPVVRPRPRRVDGSSSLADPAIVDKRITHRRRGVHRHRRRPGRDSRASTMT